MPGLSLLDGPEMSNAAIPIVPLKLLLVVQAAAIPHLTDSTDATANIFKKVSFLLMLCAE
ncbi:hypothetical protein WT22_01795 [Burkholderia territorii]|nr:hypothetical protein WT22_01795 [Burkholderia territorii]KWA42419.1 hypothetical protein WT40_02875 [Burkholderia territorii]